MSTITPVAAAGFESGAPLLNQLGVDAAASGAAMPGTVALGQGAAESFQSALSASLDALNQKVATADELVRQFALDDNIPVHRVTIALEEARLSVELAMQVRARLVETYRELMNMQL